MAKKPTTAQLISHKIMKASVAAVKTLTLLDCVDVSIRQPSLKRLHEVETYKLSDEFIKTLLLTCYDPVTNKPSFGEDDIEILENLPYETSISIMNSISTHMGIPTEGEVLGNSSGTQGESNN